MNDKQIKKAQEKQAADNITKQAFTTAGRAVGGETGGNVISALYEKKKNRPNIALKRYMLSKNPIVKKFAPQINSVLGNSNHGIDTSSKNQPPSEFNNPELEEQNKKNISPSSNLTKKNPLKLKSKSGFINKVFTFLKSRKNTEEQTGTLSIEDLHNKITFFTIVATIVLYSTLAIILLIVIVTVVISPIAYTNELIGNVTNSVNSFGEKLGNFLTLKGWCTDEECQEREELDFYEEIKKVYEEYKSTKNVNLDVSVIAATLTYSDPFITKPGTDDEITDINELIPSNVVDFKKSKKKVRILAENMVTECCLENGMEYQCAEYPDKNLTCPIDVIDEETGEVIKKYEKTWKIDIDYYKEFLKNDFIRKFYYDNKEGKDVDIKVDETIDEIFARVAFYEESLYTSTSNHFSINNATVTVLDCNNGIVIDEVSLYEYLQGVLYHEGYATQRPLEFLKVMAIVAKNYLYAANNADVDNIPTQLRIKSCQMNQIYCSVTEGCHSMEDGTADKYDTIASGPDSNGNYLTPPLDANSETLKKIKQAIDETFSEFIVKDGKFVSTQYRSSCVSEICNSTTNIMDQSVAYEMIKNGSNYKDILNYFYNGNMEEIDLYVTGYPLDLENNNVTSAFGWRLHPTSHCCSHHNGTDIAAPENANIYAIADGVIIINESHWSYGNYIVIGHGSYDKSTNTYEYYSLYAHQIRLSKLVTVGDKVKAGQLIGNVGSSGVSTGPHLHIEIYKRVNGSKVGMDAVEFFKGVELTGQVGGTLYNSEQECMASTGMGSCS